VPQLDGGVYLVRVTRGTASSEREALFVPGIRIGSKKATLRSLGDIFGKTSWWTYYDGSARRSIKLANPFWLYTALTAADPAERDRVVATVAGIDATTYGTSNVARRRIARCLQTSSSRYSAPGVRASGSRASSGRRTSSPAATPSVPTASATARSRRSDSDIAAAAHASMRALDLVRRSRYKRDESAWIPTRCARAPMPSPLSASASTTPPS